jgi:hypothetical protein
MARRASSFKRRDVERAIRSARAAGIEVAMIEVITADGTTIRVLGKPSGEPQADDLAVREWDEATAAIVKLTDRRRRGGGK